jgi:hypothetical protein
MKKIILLLTISLGCIMTNAQQIDTTLLYGKWDMYTDYVEGQRICRDSLPQFLEARIKKKQSQDTSARENSDDSLLVEKMKNYYSKHINNMFKTYMTFDKKGHISMQFGDKKNEAGEYTQKTGTYTWTGENEISVQMGESTPVSLTILKLTATKLEIIPEDKYGRKDRETIFIRAK